MSRSAVIEAADPEIHFLDGARPVCERAVTVLAATLAGTIVGTDVNTGDHAHSAGLDYTWRYTDMWAPELCGLLVGLAMLALINWWRLTFNLLAVRFLASHFPVLGLVVLLLAVITAFAAHVSGLTLPLGCAAITGLFVATAAARLFIAAVSRTVLYPALRTYFDNTEDPVGRRYQG
ncbi:hypothetical protein ACWEKT_21015 [Nocardia takedensis]